MIEDWFAKQTLTIQERANRMAGREEQGKNRYLIHVFNCGPHFSGHVYYSRSNMVVRKQDDVLTASIASVAKNKSYKSRQAQLRDNIRAKHGHNTALNKTRQWSWVTF